MRIGGAIALAGALVLSGCGQDYVTDSQASVLLIIENIQSGAPVLSDVRSEGQSIVNCDILVLASVLPKNPNAPGTPRDDVGITSYQVRYSRSDGRNVQGVDVPYEISGPLTQRIVVGGSQEMSITVVRHQAKIEPPLNNITGLDIVTMSAEVSLYGSTVNGDGVVGSGSVQITFADYADGTPTCEAS